MHNRIFTTLLILVLIAFNFKNQAQTLQEFGASNLPLVVIDVSGGGIPDEPKIKGRMGIIWNGVGQTNSGSDTFNDFDGDIAIENIIYYINIRHYCLDILIRFSAKHFGHRFTKKTCHFLLFLVI